MEHRAGEQGSVAIKIRDETNINVQGAKGWKRILNVRTAEKTRVDDRRMSKAIGGGHIRQGFRRHDNSLGFFKRCQMVSVKTVRSLSSFK